MGMEFFYCRTCGTRVTGSDLQSGEARRSSTQIRCGECLKKASPNTRRLLGIAAAAPAAPPT